MQSGKCRRWQSAVLLCAFSARIKSRKFCIIDYYNPIHSKKAMGIHIGSHRFFFYYAFRFFRPKNAPPEQTVRMFKLANTFGNSFFRPDAGNSSVIHSHHGISPVCPHSYIPDHLFCDDLPRHDERRVRRIEDHEIPGDPILRLPERKHLTGRVNGFTDP